MTPGQFTRPTPVQVTLNSYSQAQKPYCRKNACRKINTKKYSFTTCELDILEKAAFAEL